jgi:pimeloyl-ACP methyl ester carboxylesterase
VGPAGVGPVAWARGLSPWPVPVGRRTLPDPGWPRSACHSLSVRGSRARRADDGRPRPAPAGLVRLGAVLAATVVLAGCSGLAGSSLARPGVPHPGGVPPGTATTAPASTTTTVVGPPVTPISWSPCQNGLQCGSVPVPLDYFRAGSPVIDIAVARHPAGDPAADDGALVINPGGPGGSGIDDLPSELAVLSPGLLEHFDVVSFDPRGVDRSAPVRCGESGATSVPQGLLPDPVPMTAAAQRAVLADDEAYAQACEKASGWLLPYVGTVDAALDLDRIRAALGQTQLVFFGHSYGTLLGLTYAAMFPTHVRAMVLDGVIDPAIGAEQMVTDQAVGFENVLERFFAWCGSTACPWQEGADPLQTLLELASRLRASPLPAGGGRQAGVGELYTAVLSALYDTSGWSELASALAGAENGDGSGLLEMTDAYDSENGPNSVDAENAITCLDHPVPSSPSVYPRMAAQAAAVAPFFGPMFVWGLLQCAVWPAAPTRTPAPVRAAGAPPILLVSSSGDPATPHEWAQAVEAELARAVLVTWQGDNHVAYYYSPCVRAIDQAYLLDGTLPANGTVCSD